MYIIAITLVVERCPGSTYGQIAYYVTNHSLALPLVKFRHKLHTSH